MRTWALTHDSIITRIVDGAVNPFHASLRAVEVTGIPAQVGNTVDAMGNVGPSVAVSVAEAAKRRPGFVAAEAAYVSSRGVWLPVGDPNGHLFDASPSGLATLSALAQANADHTPDVVGTLVEIPAADVFKAASDYLGAVTAWQAALLGDENASTTEGWPDNGAPDQKAAAPVAITPARPVGTGIVPEQTVDVPHADTGLQVAGTVEAPVVQPG